MNKKLLIALSVAAAAAAPLGAARAATVVYGKVNLSVDAWDTQTSAQNLGGAGKSYAGFRGSRVNRGHNIDLDSNQTAVGVKGSEALGGGLKAIYQLEWQLDPTVAGGGSSAKAGGYIGNAKGSKDVWTGRDMWIGLKSAGMGTVRFGTVTTSYKQTGKMVDPLWRTSLQARSLGMESPLQKGVGEDGQGRASRTIRYDSPSMMGAKLIGTYTLHANTKTANDDPYSLALVYHQGPILGFASYITNSHGGNDSAWKIGGKFSYAGAALFGQFEKDNGLITRSFGLTSDSYGGKGYTTSGANAGGANTWFLGGSYKMGRAMVIAEYGQGGMSHVSGTKIANDETAYLVAAKYAFSRRTYVYGGWARVAANTEAVGFKHQDLLTIGMAHSF
ncbi:major outer membrane protein P.IB precursor [bacterium BMS3Abin12]|nr:major outer membrane protein P.IB precursor [bacterium BMS3Abin12]